MQYNPQLLEKLQSTGLRLTSDYTNSIRVLRLARKYSDEINTNANNRLRNSHECSMKAITSAFINQLGRRKVDRMQMLQLVSFKTWNGSIKALACVQCFNSARNHRKRFLDTGLLFDYELKPQDRCQEWLLNPLLITRMEPGDEQCEQLVKTFVETLFEQRDKGAETCLLMALNQVYPSKIEPIELSSMSIDYRAIVIEHVNNVDKSVHRPNKEAVPAKFDALQAARTGKQQETGKPQAKIQAQNVVFSQNKKEEVAPVSTPRQSFKGTATQQTVTASAVLPRQRKDFGELDSKGFPVFIKNQVRSFLLLAMQLLYPGVKLCPGREQDLLNMIYCEFYNVDKNPDFTAKRWVLHHQSLCQRLQKIPKYISKHDLFIPPPEYYFSPPSTDPKQQTSEFKFYKSRQKDARMRLQRIYVEIAAWQRRKGRHKDKTAHDLYEIHAKAMLQFASNTSVYQEFITKTIYKYVRY